MKALALTPSSPFRASDIRVHSCRFAVETGAFRAYPRLTVPILGRTGLIAPKRPKQFSRGFPRLIRGCATGLASDPQEPATIRTYSHLLARLASTCAEKKFGRNKKSRLRVLRASVVRPGITPNNRKSRLLTPFKKLSPKPLPFPHNLTHNPDLTLRVPPRPHVKKSLPLTPWSQATANVANCRRSKIPSDSPPLNLNGPVLRRQIAASSRIKVSKGKYNQIKPLKPSAHDPVLGGSLCPPWLSLLNVA